MTDWGNIIERHDSLTSTNDRALALAREGVEGAVLAAEQTSGRGQRGRTWSSPPGSGLYVSFIARPEVPAAKAPLLTLLCGVAVHDALCPWLSTPIGLKWPNDVLAAEGPQQGRKLAGILVESASRGDQLEYVVFGVGVNLKPATHDGDAASRAVSMVELGADNPDPDLMFESVRRALARGLRSVQKRGVGFISPEWSERAIGLGRYLTVSSGSKVFQGRLLGAASDGALRLLTDMGEQPVVSGEVDPAGLFPT